MSIFNEFTKKEKPVFTGSRFGFGSGAGGGGTFVAAPGQIAFTDHPGGSAQTWTVPEGVTSISVVLIGGGAGADGQNNGSGGGLTWINNVTVVPGTDLTVYNGKTGGRNGSGNPGGSDTDGQDSYINDASGSLIARAKGGRKNTSSGGGSGGNDSSNIGSNYNSLTYGGGRGGHGNQGNTGKGGGGGGGGYSGNGGNGGAGGYAGQDGSGGGGGGGGGHQSTDGGQGGGTGLLGEGSNGSGGSAAQYGNPGGGGSGGGAGAQMYGYWTTTTGAFGGGSGAGSGGAGRGAVRIIWPGDARLFPSTRTADE